MKLSPVVLGLFLLILFIPAAQSAQSGVAHIHPSDYSHEVGHSVVICSDDMPTTDGTVTKPDGDTYTVTYDGQGCFSFVPTEPGTWTLEWDTSGPQSLSFYAWGSKDLQLNYTTLWWLLFTGFVLLLTKVDDKRLRAYFSFIGLLSFLPFHQTGDTAMRDVALLTSAVFTIYSLAFAFFIDDEKDNKQTKDNN